MLGSKVKDKITGTEGIVIGATEWLYGCIRVVIQAQEVKDGKPSDPFVVDFQQLEVISKPAVPVVARNAGVPPVSLGSTVKDTITGLSGIAIARSTWLHNLPNIIVQPRELKDGKPVDNFQVDESRLEVVEVDTLPRPAPVKAEEPLPIMEKKNPGGNRSDAMPRARVDYGR